MQERTFYSPNILDNLVITEKYTNNLWRLIDNERYKNKISPQKWPNWVFIPHDLFAKKILKSENLSDALYRAVNKTAVDGDLLGGIVTFKSMIEIFGTWRYTKGIYSFNEELFEELLESTLDSAIPTDVLKRLPEWCIYIKFPYKVKLAREGVPDDEIDSFFYMNSSKIDSGFKEIVCHFMLLNNGQCNGIMSFSLNENESLEECLTRTRDTYYDIDDEKEEFMLGFYSRLLNLILFICSKEPEITGEEIPGQFKHKLTHHKGYPKIYIPPHAREFKVGEKVGKKLKTFKELMETRKIIRPHIRRAHWHGYWIKNKDNKELEFNYKWLAPAFVIGKNKIVNY